MNKTIHDYIREIHATAVNQDDVVPLLQDMFDDYGEAATEALFLMPELPETSSQAMYMITHAVERTEDNKYVAMLLGQLPLMVQVAPRYMTFLLRRCLRSPSCFSALKQQMSGASPESKNVLLALFHSWAGDTQQPVEFTDRCKAGIEVLSI